MKRVTREWVHKAEDDYKLAAMLARQKPLFRDQICFHCQQAAEKYLKSLMEEQGVGIPKTHDLGTLLALLLSHYSALRSHRRGVVFLTNFAVAARYPGFSTTKRQATSALRWAGKIRQECRRILGLRTR